MARRRGHFIAWVAAWLCLHCASAGAVTLPLAGQVVAPGWMVIFVVLAVVAPIIVYWRARRALHAERALAASSTAALARSEARFRNLFEHTPAISVQGYDGSRRVIYWNKASEALYGYSMGEALGRRLEELIIPEAMRDAVIADVDAWVRGGPGIPASELTLRRRDGSPVHVFSSHVMLHSGNGEPEMYCIDIDFTERKLVEQQLRKLSLAVEQSPASIVITDTEGSIEYVNEAFVRTTGYSPAEVLGQNPRILHSGRTPEETYAMLWAAVARGQAWKGEFINRRRDGSEYIESATITPVREADGRVSHLLAIKQDITEQKRAEERIRRLSYYDALTGLPNRALLMDRLGLVLAVSQRQARQDALLVFNIDRFKVLNDARGHAVGDLLLQQVGRRLEGILREGDTLARLAADEFAILLQALDVHRDDASRRALSVAEKVHAAMREPFELDGETAAVTASIGITLCPDDAADSAQDILRRAATALHRAKDAGGNQSAFFEIIMGEMAQHKFRIERELRAGIPAGELRLYLQSQVDGHGRIVGAEALVRWQHPVRGILPPAVFVPVAEQSDLICELDAWMLASACRLMAAHGTPERPLRLSVNVSPRHFRQPGFVVWIRDLIGTCGVEPSHLTLEVTEGLMIDDIDAVVAKMTALTALGLRFSVDDFGTGYSSLAYLKRLPLHELKIDRSFVQDAPDDADDAALVDTMLAVARNLHLQVVAEGVESAAQAEFLNARCAVVHQGYLYGKPQPAADWIARWCEGQGRSGAVATSL